MNTCETCEWWEKEMLTISGNYAGRCRNSNAMFEAQVCDPLDCFGCIHHQPKSEG